MTTHPIFSNLYEGPMENGKQTWFCRGRHVPIGAKRRLAEGSLWETTIARGEVAYRDRIYQVKDVRQPDPEGWHQPDGSIVTLVKHLRGRRDLAEWAYVTQTGYWNDSKSGYRALANIVGDEGTLNADIGERGIHIRRVS